LAIGFTVMTGAFAMGDISGGVFNPPWPWGYP
jgi:glycerol uptake facilitator-like aquaporin